MSLYDSNTLRHWNNGVSDARGIYDQALYYPNYSQSETEKTGNKMEEASAELRNRIIMFQGLVLELQRKAGKAEKFDKGIYNEINQTMKILENLMNQLKMLTEQVEYTKDIVDAAKVSQELSDGFENQKSNGTYTIGIDYAKLSGISPSIIGNNIVPCTTAVDSSYYKKILNDSFTKTSTDTVTF